ncbi:MAG TPA: hypothetical protein VN461_22525 [Vicinamibacteria bacterium]|nr:hypothetical protein [Vicinamibacteria bacterium]
MGPRPVLLAWLLLAGLTGLPYLRAALDPPPGTTFVGFFFYADDQYNYLSFVQQAEDGAFRFRNKLVEEPHPPALLNLEWWLVGRLSAALGHHPLVAYRLLGLAAALALLAGLDAWLRAMGLPDPHRLPALLLVTMGGGLGGILFTFGDQGRWYLDLFTGLFPFIGLLVNAHFVTGTALLLWTLWAYLRARTPLGQVGASALGTVLGLVRPYDLVLLVAIRSLGVLVTEPIRLSWRRLLPLAGLAPVVLYNYWLFYRTPAFAFYRTAFYEFPGLGDFALALGPAALLAALAIPGGRGAPDARGPRAHLWAWALLAAAIILARPVHFSLQFLVGVGVPLLALGAVGLARFGPGVMLVAVLPLAGTALAALRLVSGPTGPWFVPSERLAVAQALRGSCRPGDVLLSPPDIGQYAAGLTACRAYVSHPIGPDYARRTEEVRAFFGTWDPTLRAAFLDRHCITHLTLPGDAGPVPGAWLGEATAFRALARVGQPTVISVYAREGGGGCWPP